MDKSRRVYFFIGTTAEFIKLAPVIKELIKRKVVFKIITSGQNKINFEELEEYVGKLKSDISLPEKSKKASISSFLIWGIRALFRAFVELRKECKGLNKKNSYFIVHGDTASSFIGSFIGFLFGLKLIHIESGLRSFNFFEPFPEELFRYLNMRFADILFCPNHWSQNNIKNFKGVKIDTKQNTLVESFLWATSTNKKLDFRKKYGKYYILYIRRQEHIYFQKSWTKKIILTVLKNTDPNISCIFTLNILNENIFFSLNRENDLSKYKIKTIGKLPYKQFMRFMSQAEFMATDGCTNQEEAYYMGLPLLALRNLTERVEGLNENVVISKGKEKVIRDFLKNYKKFKRPAIKLHLQPAKTIVDYLFSN